MDQEAMIERIRSGDGDAFEEFVRRHQRLIFFMVCRMVPETADREDLCQDVFLKAFRSLPRFRNECKLSTWLARIAYTTCLNHIKKGKRGFRDPGLPEDLPDPELAPDRRMERDETSLRLTTEMAKLPAAYRAVLTLFHLEDMPVWEIAKVMDLPEGTVKSHLFRARRLLKDRLTMHDSTAGGGVSR
jgi:RNA polymerase sigma-70 factor (ECF subfamily)